MMKNTYLSAAASVAFALVSTSIQAADPSPQMKAVLDQHASLNPKPIEQLTPAEARKQPPISQAAADLMRSKGMKPESVGDTDDRKLDVGDHNIAARVYTPKGEGPFPVILYIHGGGWVIATIDTYDSTPRALVNLTNAVVVSIEYRKSPEDKFPAAHEDSFGAYQWLLKNAGKIKGDPKKIAIVGESAGGNMAAAVSLMASEAKLQMPVAQVLVYPVVDATGKETPSKLEYADAKPLNTPMLAWFTKYLIKSEEDKNNPKLSLMMAGDALKSLPPTTIVGAQIDPLASEGKDFADALTKAGVQVNYKCFDGVTHEFFGMGGVVDTAKEAEAFAAADLKKAFGM